MKGILYTDGGARGNPGPSGMAAVLFDENNKLISFDGKYNSFQTNNQAEYQALLIGLKLAVKNGVTELSCLLDSELVVKQLRGEYKIKDEGIKHAKLSIDAELVKFKSVTFSHVMREQNKHADRLVNIVLDTHKQ